MSEDQTKGALASAPRPCFFPRPARARLRGLARLWTGLVVLCLGGRALLGAAAADDRAVREDLARVILAEEAARPALLAKIAASGSKTAGEVLAAWARDGVYVFEETGGAKVPVILEEQQDGEGRSRAQRIDTGAWLAGPDGRELRVVATDLTAAETDALLRKAIQSFRDTLALADPSAETRRSAAAKLGLSGKAQYIPMLEARLAVETDRDARRAVGEALALLELSGTNLAARVEAARHLGAGNALGAYETLKKLAVATNTPPDLARAADQAARSIAGHMDWVNGFGTVFRGLSTGSILIVVALGLAVTFGLMNVINMAHGEMMAVGAYTTYLIQNIFGAGYSFSIALPFQIAGKPLVLGAHLPGMNASGAFYESYFLFALPLSFLAAALAGLFLERTVVRFLYRRPLESLLATWGVSLVMQQLFRMVFGANNVQVNSPSWLQGHFEVNDVSFGYNRVFVIGFAVLIVAGTWLLLARTRLGLLIRAVMQNREMAACLGVRSDRVNMLTFAFGSGLAGAFLSQIGNVGPSMGQGYIIDSFMTVVVGGVGSIVGTVCAATGIGASDQVLQQVLGSPVLGKITVLAFIILFLQWKPGGLFPTRNRGLD